MKTSVSLPCIAAVLAACFVLPSAHAQKVDTGPKAVKPERLSFYWTLDNNSVVADVPNLARGIAESMGKHIRFNPTTNNMGRDRVFSWLIFPYNMPSDPAKRSATMQPCAIDSIAPELR